MEEIKFDKRNYRIHNEKNKALIQKSLKDCGAGRSILLDKEGVIIAGNGVFEQAQALGIPVKIIKIDGKELIALQRTDLATGDPKRKELAATDNSTTDTSTFNHELLLADFDVPTLQELGISIEGLDCIADMPELKSGDKEPFQQMTFTLADEQAETIKEALELAKKDTNFDFVERMGNENSNGNALFMIVQEWLSGKR